MRIGLLKRWLKGLPELEAAVAAERGPFAFFALIEEEEWNEYGNYPVGSSWHIYAAAPWIWAEGFAAEQFLRERIRPYEDPRGFRVPSLRIHVVQPTSPYLEEVWEYCGTENGMVEIYDVEILDITAKRGYIFSSRRPDNFEEILREAQKEVERQRQRDEQGIQERRAWLQAQLQDRATS